MATVVNVTVLSLFLLMFGPVLQHVSAVPFLYELDAVSLIAGSYSNAAQVEEQLLTYNELQNDNLTLEFVPWDFPPFNVFFPLQVTEVNQISGAVLWKGVVFFFNDTQIIASFNSFSDETRQRLSLDPTCMAQVILQNGEATADFVCGNPFDVTYTFTHTCTSLIVTLRAGTPKLKKYTGTPYQFQKVQQYPFPASWLVGDNEGYVSPCPV